MPLKVAVSSRLDLRDLQLGTQEDARLGSRGSSCVASLPLFLFGKGVGSSRYDSGVLLDLKSSADDPERCRVVEGLALLCLLEFEPPSQEFALAQRAPAADIESDGMMTVDVGLLLCPGRYPTGADSSLGGSGGGSVNSESTGMRSL